MNKIENSILSSFIQRYNLNKLIEKAIIKCEDGVLTCNTCTPDKSNVVYLKQNNVKLEDFEIGAMTSSELNSLLSFLSEDLEIVFEKNSKDWIHQINVSDGTNSFVYHTSSTDILEEAPELEDVEPEYETNIVINNEMIGNFIKSSGTLNASYFVVNSNGKKTEIVMNYNKVKANTITFNVETLDDKHFKTKNELIIKTDFIKQIFLSNKTFDSGLLSISSEGLVKLVFTNGDLSATYICLLTELNN